MDCANIVVWDWDPANGAARWSDNFGRLLGRDPGRVVPTYQGFLDLIHPEDRESVERAVAAAIDQRRDYCVECRIPGAAGTARWLCLRGAVVTDGAGRPERILGILQDITSRKSAEQARTCELAWLRVIQEASALANSRLEYAGTFGPVAAALRKLIPVDHFMIVLRQEGKAVFAAIETAGAAGSGIAPDTRVPFRGSFLEHLRDTGRPHVIPDLAAENRYPEDALILNDGMRSCVRLPIYGSGEFLGMLALASREPGAFGKVHLPYLESLAIQVANTVANIRRYQRTVSEAERLATVVREAHHRIKNNLQGVIGLLDRYRSAAPGLGAIIGRAVGQLHAVAEVHNLLSRQTRETVHLHTLVRDVCRAAYTLCVHPIETEMSAETGALVVSAGEAVPVALILNELIQNAVDHGYPDGRVGTIRITLLATPAQVCLRVADDGIAPPRNLDARGGDGPGMGLDLVRALLPPRGPGLRLYRDGEWTIAEVGYNRKDGAFSTEEP